MTSISQTSKVLSRKYDLKDLKQKRSKLQASATQGDLFAAKQLTSDEN